MEKALLKWLRTPLGLQLQFFYLTLKLLRVEVLYLNCLYMFIQQKVLDCLYLLIIYIKEKELGISFCACRLCSYLVDSYIKCFFFLCNKCYMIVIQDFNSRLMIWTLIWNTYTLAQIKEAAQSMVLFISIVTYSR